MRIPLPSPQGKDTWYSKRNAGLPISSKLLERFPLGSGQSHHVRGLDVQCIVSVQIITVQFPPVLMSIEHRVSLKAFGGHVIRRRKFDAERVFDFGSDQKVGLVGAGAMDREHGGGTVRRQNGALARLVECENVHRFSVARMVGREP
jgi:hypothetical protein